jgi:hypothetical protein
LERNKKKQVIFVVSKTNKGFHLLMKSIYLEVHDKLISMHEHKLEGHAYSRLKQLSGFITGMISKGNSSLPDVGSGIPQNIDANSKTTAAKRFVSNKWTDIEAHFLPYLVVFLRSILSLILPSERISFVIDGSQMGKHNASLMISLYWHNRGIPVCWFVKKGEKGHFKEADHVTLLKTAHSILSPLLINHTKVTILGDGEFDGTKLQQLCLSFGWDYVCRTASNTIMYENGEPFKAKQVTGNLQQDCFFIPQVEFTKKRFKYVNFLCWHNQKRHQNPIFLISNLSYAGDIMYYYDQRYSIECLFKDLKTNSFNLQKTRLKKPEEVSNLILIAALAFLMLIALALNNDSIKLKKKVQRVRKDRKVLSTCSFAYALLKYFLQYELPLNFSFHFSKNFT